MKSYSEYIPLAKVVVEVLEKNGKPMKYYELLQVILRLYQRGARKTTLRIFQTPDGKFWSPELNEALQVLSLAGIVKFDGETVSLLLS